MSFQRGSDCPAAVEVERHSVGEQVSGRAHIEGCSSCAAYVRQLQEASTAFAKQRPAELVLKQLEGRKARRPAVPRWLFAALGALVALVVVVPRLIAPADGVRLKGGNVEVYFKRGAADPARLLDGARVKPGDALRFRYRGEQPAHLAVIERDEKGAVTVFAPFRGSDSVEAGPDEFLVDTVALDPTPGACKLFIVRAARRFDLAPLLKAISARQDPACDGCTVDVLRYEK